MATEPPDKPSGRPPIRSLDEPIDDSGADIVEKRREERRSQAELPLVVTEALRLRGLGFAILPLPTNAKFPPPKDWSKAAVNNPVVFLQNPGTHNYAILPPPGCFGWDVDKEVPELLSDLTTRLGPLPPTIVTVTPNGKHAFYRWPEDLKDRPRGPWFGEVVTRWALEEDGQGYLVGPGSVVMQADGSVGQYRALDQRDEIADLPRPWAEAALRWRPANHRLAAGREPVAQLTEHYKVPESVEPGGRYSAMLSYTAAMYNRGLSRDAMWGAVQSELVPRFTEKLTLKELKERFERAVRDIEDRLGEPKALPVVEDLSSAEAAPVARGDATGAEHSAPSQVPLVPPLFLPAQKQLDVLGALGEQVWFVDDWVAANAVMWWAGQPKSMKSMAVMQMLGAWVAGDDWMEKGMLTGVTRVGLYATKEGTPYDTASRIRDIMDRNPSANWHHLRVAYPTDMSFDKAGLQQMWEYLAQVESDYSVMPQAMRAILVIDPMRDFMLPGWDENEAKTIGLVKSWCRQLKDDFGWLSIIIVHHLRKSAGNEGGDGLDMSGSGAGYAAGDATVNWWAKRDFADDDDDDGEALVKVQMRLGGYKVEHRGHASLKGRWSFDPMTRVISRERGVRTVATASGNVRAVAGDRTKQVLDILRIAGAGGLSVAELHSQTDIPNVQNVRTILYRAAAKEECSFVGTRWYARGWSPGVAPDGLLPPAAADDDGWMSVSEAYEKQLAKEKAAAAPPPDDPDSEVFIDPLHRLD